MRRLRPTETRARPRRRTNGVRRTNGLPWLLVSILACLPLRADPVPQGNQRWYYVSPLDGTYQPYYIYIPRDFAPATPHPVVMSMHGFGGRTGTAAGDAWRQNWADCYQWILIRPDGRGSQNWDFIGEQDLFDILNDLQQRTPFHPAMAIDRNRIYLEGGSMGGHGAYREGFRHPDLFAAVAPGAGWTDYQEFYSHFYDAKDAPHLPEYVDPARRPVLETASSLWQTEAGRHVWVAISYDTGDFVNPRINADEVIGKLQAAQSTRFAVKLGNGGHCSSFDPRDNFQFFLGKTVTHAPRDVVYATNDLNYNKAYWVTIDRLLSMGDWGRVRAAVTGAAGAPPQITVETGNIRTFTLDLGQAPLPGDGPVTINIDSQWTVTVRGRDSVKLDAVLDADYRITGWRQAVADESPAAVCKRPGLCGPIADAFASPFTVIYGTRGGRLGADAGNPDWTAAQKFCTEWNAWTTLLWRNESPPADRRQDWWVPPYPFHNGPDIPDRQPMILPRPDTQFAPATLPISTNLILFGDVDTNWVISRLRSGLPIQILSGPEVRLRERVYRGPNLGYFFIAPDPLNLARYVVAARGYLSSNIDPGKYGAARVGKDIEALPFYWPDYVIWDQAKPPSATVQAPLLYLPETWLDAGFFDSHWKLDSTPPRTAIDIQGNRNDSGELTSPATVNLSAQDAPGGFGVDRIEWRLGDDPWRRYTDPFTVSRSGRTVNLSVRAIDRCGQFLYDPRSHPNRGAPAAGNVEPVRTVALTFAGS